ncbi:hypothetical protein EYF80_014120 [Liparis tanakae]|uniref:Uncharacterized protein n=1 Tax=Liparis tanakae TaxID=230148 RepID=A0A4Z2ICY6_9TELE|nr:hypothetical protein EYF80_014120 [Liparis tanakae]
MEREKARVTDEEDDRDTVLNTSLTPPIYPPIPLHLCLPTGHLLSSLDTRKIPYWHCNYSFRTGDIEATGLLLAERNTSWALSEQDVARLLSTKTMSNARPHCGLHPGRVVRAPCDRFPGRPKPSASRYRSLIVPSARH